MGQQCLIRSAILWTVSALAIGCGSGTPPTQPAPAGATPGGPLVTTPTGAAPTQPGLAGGSSPSGGAEPATPVPTMPGPGSTTPDPTKTTPADCTPAGPATPDPSLTPPASWSLCTVASDCTITLDRACCGQVRLPLEVRHVEDWTSVLEGSGSSCRSGCPNLPVLHLHADCHAGTCVAVDDCTK
jgi:hypothetical protein